MKGRYGSILLKKSVLVTTEEKWTPEIETLKIGKDFWVQISRSDAQKRRFHRSLLGQFGQSDFFNRIGRLRPVTTDFCSS